MPRVRSYDEPMKQLPRRTRSIKRGKRRLNHTALIISVCEDVTGIPKLLMDIHYPLKAPRHISRARGITWYCLHKYGGLTCRAIAELFGHRCTSVGEQVRRMNYYLTHRPDAYSAYAMPLLKEAIFTFHMLRRARRLPKS